MEGAAAKLLWVIFRRLPEEMRKLSFAESFWEVLPPLVWLYIAFSFTQLAVTFIGKGFPDYAKRGETAFEYLGFLPIIIVYYLFIRSKVITTSQCEKEAEKAKWKGYWEEIRKHGRRGKPVKTSVGSVVLYEVGNSYDIAPLEEEKIDIEAWEKLYRNFRQLHIGNDPEEVLRNL